MNERLSAAWEGTKRVALAAWTAIPEGARDFIKGAALGMVLGAVLGATFFR